MSDLDILRGLFLFALILWAIAAITFGKNYAVILKKYDFDYPFAVAGVWLAASNTAEVLLYSYIVWLNPTHHTLTRYATFGIPIMIASQAIAYMFIANWAQNRPLPKGWHFDDVSKTTD